MTAQAVRPRTEVTDGGTKSMPTTPVIDTTNLGPGAAAELGGMIRHSPVATDLNQSFDEAPEDGRIPEERMQDDAAVAMALLRIGNAATGTSSAPPDGDGPGADGAGVDGAVGETGGSGGSLASGTENVSLANQSEEPQLPTFWKIKADHEAGIEDPYKKSHELTFPENAILEKDMLKDMDPVEFSLRIPQQARSNDDCQEHQTAEIFLAWHPRWRPIR